MTPGKKIIYINHKDQNENYKVEKNMSRMVVKDFSDFIKNSKSCVECGSPLLIVKNRRRVCYLACSYCKHIEYLTPGQVNDYIEKIKVKCPYHDTYIYSGLSRYGVYVRCKSGNHFMNPDEI